MNKHAHLSFSSEQLNRLLFSSTESKCTQSPGWFIFKTCQQFVQSCKHIKENSLINYINSIDVAQIVVKVSYLQASVYPRTTFCQEKKNTYCTVQQTYTIYTILYLQHIKELERLTCKVQVVLLVPWSTDRCPPPAPAHPPSQKTQRSCVSRGIDPVKASDKGVQFTNLPCCFLTLLDRNLIWFSLIFRHCKPQAHYKYSNSTLDKSIKL